MILNLSLPEGTPIGCGYIIRDSKGIELAGSNTWSDSISIKVPEVEKTLGMLIKIKIPMLHSGCYSLTPSVSSWNENHGIVIQDRILNALVFKVTTNKEIYTPIRFESKFMLYKIDNYPTHKEHT